MTADDLEAFWGEVHDAAGWTVGRSSQHVEAPERPWRVYAIDLRRRAKEREYVEATGWTEAEALRDLAGLPMAWKGGAGGASDGLVDRRVLIGCRPLVPNMRRGS